VHGVLALLLALGPAAPASSTDMALDSEQCRARELDFFHSLGPADAPTTVRLYVDPTAPETNPLRAWLELRRIAGERGGELRVELVPSRGGLAEGDADSDAVRLWFMAVAALGKAEDALRVLDRQDWQRVVSELRSEEGRARLARAVELEPADIEARRTGASGACLRRSLERASNHLALHTMGQRSSLVGVVVRGGQEQFKYVDNQLSELRTQIDHLVVAPELLDDAIGFVPYIPPTGGRASRFDRTFPETGVLVGGDALPHRLIIFVEDEEAGRLPDWLSPAMRYRTQSPGELSVQVVAAGVGSRAISLRRRLCAARTLGLEVEYLHHLSKRPAVRRLHEGDLYEVLQPVADSDACSDSEPLESRPDEGEPGASRRDFGHPRGAWLDGRPVNPSDLDTLDWELSQGEGDPQIIDWLITPTGLAGEGASFEF
jgi:hypothetical protein